MKVRVLREFIDKETKEVRKKGTVMDMSEERYREIMESTAYIEKVEEKGSCTGAEKKKKS